MKKIRNLSEGDFLKLLFAFFSLAFLVAAVCMGDRANMLSGLWQILSNPSKISTNYFALGGYAGMENRRCGVCQKQKKESFAFAA